MGFILYTIRFMIVEINHIEVGGQTMKIAVITDSGSGLSAKEASDLGIYYLPLQILHKETQYLDGESITLRQVYDFLHQEEDLTTSMPPMARVEKTLEHIKADGYDTIIAVPITLGLSSTASVLNATAKDMGIKIHCIDVFTTCNIQNYIARSAKQLVDMGLEADEIVARLQESIDHSNTLIIPDDLQHLKRGGRLTPLAAALGGLLKIKPILKLNVTSGGKIDVCDKVRTMSKAQAKAIATFQDATIGEDYLLTVLHTDAPEEGERLKEQMELAFPGRELFFGYIGAVISVHTGIGCIGIQYVKKVKGL